jgi:hypothetical protein
LVCEAITAMPAPAASVDALKVPVNAPEVHTVVVGVRPATEMLTGPEPVVQVPAIG